MKHLIVGLGGLRVTATAAFVVCVFGADILHAAVGGCGGLIMLEFKNGETNRIKTGTQGRFPSTNSWEDINIYRDYTHVHSASASEHRPTCVDFDNTESSFERRIWPTDYQATNVISGAGCGTVNPFQTNWSRRTFGAVNIQCDTNNNVLCTNECINNVWLYTNCPPFALPYATLGVDAVVVTNYNTDDHYRVTSTKTDNPTNDWIVIHAEMDDHLYTNLYTTAELVQRLTNDVVTMIDAQTNWSCSGSAWLSIDERGLCASEGATKFRYKCFARKGQVVNVKIKITYTATSMVGTTSSVSWATSTTDTYIETNIVGTGNVFISPETCVFPPSGGNIRYSSATIKLESAAACDGVPAFAASEPELDSGPFMAFGLGGSCAAGGSGATGPGFAYFQGTSPDASLADPASLTPFVNLCMADVVSHGGPIEQIKVDAGLMVVTPSGGPGYDIEFYSQCGAKNPATGLYAPEGVVTRSYNVALVRTVPDYRLRISCAQGGYTEFIHTNGWWYLDRGDGVLSERWGGEVNEQGQVISETSQSVDANGMVITSHTTVRTNILNLGTLVTLAEINGYGAEAETNHSFYNTAVPTNDVNYGKAILTVTHSGGFTRTEYDPTSGRMTATVTGIGNAATNASSAETRRTEFSYGAFHPQDSLTSEPDTPRIVKERIGDTVIKMTRIAIWPNNRLEVQFKGSCFNEAPDQAWSAEGNLRTLITDLYFANGTGTRTIHPDNTVTFTYTLTNSAGTYRTNITAHGAPNPSGEVTNVLDGELTVSVVTTSDGKTSYRRTFDIDSGRMTASESYSYSGLANRSYTVTNLSGETITYLYSDCCGTLSAMVDADGVTTDFSYDARKNQITSRRLGIVTSNVVNAAGQVIETWRFPVAGSPIRLSASSYDTLGRLKAATNALGYPTFYTYAILPDGRAVTTTTFPDSSWQEEYRNRDGSMDRTVGSAAFPASYSYGLDAATHESYTEETKLDANGSPTSEWVRTYTDAFGREFKRLFPAPGGQGYASTEERYNSYGQRDGSRDADGNWTYFFYNAKGELYETSLDMDGVEVRNDTVDRTTRTSGSVVQNSEGCWVRQTVSTLLPEGGSATTNETSFDGLTSWNISFGRTNRTSRTLTDPGTGIRTVTVTSADGTYTVSTYTYGRLTTVDRYDSDDEPLGGTAYEYDAHGRQWKITDVRNGATTYGFNDGDQIIAVTNPPAASGQSALVLRTQYDAIGRSTNVIQPDGAASFTSYYPTDWSNAPGEHAPTPLNTLTIRRAALLT